MGEEGRSGGRTKLENRGEKMQSDPAIVCAGEGEEWNETNLLSAIRSKVKAEVETATLPILEAPKLGKVDEWLEGEGKGVRDVLRLALERPHSAVVIVRTKENTSSFCVLQKILSSEAERIRFFYGGETVFLHPCDAIVFKGTDFVEMRSSVGEEKAANVVWNMMRDQN